MQQDRVRAAELYGTACDGGDASSCARRIPLLKFECDSGQADDCWDLAKMYAQGRGVPVDYRAAFTLLQRGCDHGSDVACTEAGTFYIRGLGVKQNTDKGLAV